MKRISALITGQLAKVNLRYLPFADVASADLPLNRLARLSLFQISVGMATVLLIGTLNRVMIVELGMSAWVVSLMVSLPFLFAPARALVGFKSDTHRSAFGWRRVPYIWLGTMLQFGGLSIMPFALLVMSGDGVGSPIYGEIGAALAFLLVGTGLHTTQTAGLALATDLAQPGTRPRVVALMYVMLMAGMIASGISFGILLADFSPMRLIQVVQGAAVVTVAVNVVALWKQELGVLHDAPRRSRCNSRSRGKPSSKIRRRCAFLSRSASAPLPLTCRTSFWSRTAGKCSVCRSARRQCLPLCWQAAR